MRYSLYLFDSLRKFEVLKILHLSVLFGAVIDPILWHKHWSLSPKIIEIYCQNSVNLIRCMHLESDVQTFRHIRSVADYGESMKRSFGQILEH